MKLKIVLPGLLGRVGWSTERIPDTPALDLLLARGDAISSSASDPLAALASAFGLDAAEADLPSGAISLLGDDQSLASQDHWAHADPICLTADRDRLLPFGGPRLNLSRDESDALVGALNAHFADDGLSFVAPHPFRWYLRTPTRIKTHALPLHRVHGRSLGRPLPRDPDERTWLRWQTEAQMLLHSHPVNRARELAGQMPINGLWTWGDGPMPKIRPEAAPDFLVGEHPLALGLARAAGFESGPLGSLQGLLDTHTTGHASVVAFWDPLWWPALDGDPEAWIAELAELESLARRLVDALRSKKISLLVLDDGEGAQVSIARSQLRRFWRRGKRLRERLASAA